jgi:2-oxoglutarate ferredoxin oxidoreductase subunit beta
MKNGFVINQPAVDCCTMAIAMGCGYVARSFSGDANQIVALIKGAAAYNGTAFIDIISPCVTFNDHEGSTKSYKFTREHKESLHDVEFADSCDAVPQVDYEPGTSLSVPLPDGSKLNLSKLSHDHDPTDKFKALKLLHEESHSSVVYTGLLYYNPNTVEFHDVLNMTETPLVELPDDSLRPSREVLDEINRQFRAAG